MGLKALLFLGFLIVTYLLISSEVGARELAATSNTNDTTTNKVHKTNGVRQVQYKRHRGEIPPPPPRYEWSCPYGCCSWGIGGGCTCCSYAGESVHVDLHTETGN